MFLAGSEVTDVKRDFRADWKWLLAMAMVIWTVGFLLRLFDLSTWQDANLTVGGEPILATHDAYLWLSAAKGYRAVSQSAMPEVARYFVGLTGMSYASAGFWLPALLGGLAGVVTLGFGWLFGGRFAGLAAGLVAANCPGLFVRTRLGYFDTDLFLLTLPLLAVLCMAIVMRGHTRRTWLPGDLQEQEFPDFSALKFMLLAAALGVVARSATWWHMEMNNVVRVSYWGALVLGMLLALPGRRAILLQALAVFGMGMFFDGYDLFYVLNHLRLAETLMPGAFVNPDYSSYWPVCVALTFALAGALGAGYRRCGRWVSSPWFALLVLVLVFGISRQFYHIGYSLSTLFDYLKPSAQLAAAGADATAAVNGPIWPGITQSIVEAGTVDWPQMLWRLGPTPWLAVVGTLAFFFVLLVRPAASLLLPFFGLGIAAGILGVRFTMFGSPAIALGLGLCLHWGLRYLPASLRERRWLAPAAQVLAGALMLLPLAIEYSDLNITPVIERQHAEAIEQIGEQAAPDAEIWNWWDFGYATQFYGERMTPSDGGKHTGQDIYPTALVYATQSFRQAAQVMRYSAAHGQEPFREWNTMSAEEVRAQLDAMRLDPVMDGVEVPEQYLVASWQNMRILSWMLYYGNWDLVEGKSEMGNVTPLSRYKFDPRGVVLYGEGKSVPVSSVDLLDGEERKHKDFFNGSPAHFIVNKVWGKAYVVDDTAYNSVFVQLLVADPNSPFIANHFELVEDRMPHVRVYRLRQP